MNYADITERDFSALKTFTRSLGAEVVNCDTEIEGADLASLIRLRSGVKRAMRLALKELDSAEGEARTQEIERHHDCLMAIFDEASETIEVREVEERTARRPIGNEETAPGSTLVAPYLNTRSNVWVDKDGNEIRVLAPTDKLQERSEYRGPRLGAILRAMVLGPRDDGERRALAEGTDSAGGYTVPAPLAAEFIDRLRAASVCIQAGARTVPMTSKSLRIARLTGDPAVAWRAENSQINASDATFDAVDFNAKSLMGLVQVSRELLEDSVNVSALLENSFVQSTALKFDQGLLFGSGTGAEPKGLTAQTGLTSVSMGANGAQLANYDKLIDAVYAIQAANGGNPNAAIFHPRTGASLAKLKDAQNNPLRVPDMIAKIPQLPTTSVSIAQTQGTSSDCSSAIYGDFTRMLIGMRTMLRIEVLKERYAEYNQYGFVWGMRGDVQFEHIEAFSQLVGIKP